MREKIKKKINPWYYVGMSVLFTMIILEIFLVFYITLDLKNADNGNISTIFSGALSLAGAVVGGIIAGFLTLQGVIHTINDQNEKHIYEQTIKNRAILEVSEITNASLKLNNIKNKGKKRLIITKEYQRAITLDMKHKAYNHILLINRGPGIAINCNVTIGMTYQEKTDLWKSDGWEISITIPTVDQGEEIYIPVDRIPDPRTYKFSKIEITYQTLSNETLFLKRFFPEDDSKNLYDTLYLKNDQTLKELITIDGSQTEWLVIES